MYHGRKMEHINSTPSCLSCLESNMSVENANLPPNSPTRAAHVLPILKSNEDVVGKTNGNNRLNDDGSLHSYHLWLKVCSIFYYSSSWLEFRLFLEVADNVCRIKLTRGKEWMGDYLNFRRTKFSADKNFRRTKFSADKLFRWTRFLVSCDIFGTLSRKIMVKTPMIE